MHGPTVREGILTAWCDAQPFPTFATLNLSPNPHGRCASHSLRRIEWQDERPPAPSYLRILYLGKILQDEDTLISA